MATPSAICVFCGSKEGRDPRHAAAARQLGREIAARRCDLVYGAGGIGLMGILADSVSESGGRVIGVIPRFLDDIEVGRRHSDEFLVTDSMHDRKLLMSERADAFVTLPGGLGTLDETFEIMTWKQLRLHNKPIVVVDSAGYWSAFVDLVDSTIAGGFAAQRHRDLFSVVETVEDVFPEIERLMSAP